jgi:hypothetical protein
LADAQDLKSCEVKLIPVQVRSPALEKSCLWHDFFLYYVKNNKNILIRFKNIIW